MSASGSGVETNALNNSGAAVNQANGAFGAVNPIYQRMATGTVGYDPATLARMKTSAAQGLGGAVAGATGAGDLYAARTGNAGGAAAAIDDSARAAMAAQTDADLSVEGKNADLQAKNQEIGAEGLSDLYRTAGSQGVDYLNIADKAAQARAERKQNYITMGLQAAGLPVGRR